jgi:hypothetical protein
MSQVLGGRRDIIQSTGLETNADLRVKDDSVTADILYKLFGYKCKKYASKSDNFELWYPLDAVILKMSALDDENSFELQLLATELQNRRSDLIRGTITEELLNDCIMSARMNGRSVALGIMENLAKA